MSLVCSFSSTFNPAIRTTWLCFSASCTASSSVMRRGVTSFVSCAKSGAPRTSTNRMQRSIARLFMFCPLGGRGFSFGEAEFTVVQRGFPEQRDQKEGSNTRPSHEMEPVDERLGVRLQSNAGTDESNRPARCCGQARRFRVESSRKLPKGGIIDPVACLHMKSKKVRV